MSATRQPVRDGHDVYNTPTWCTKLILPHLRQYLRPGPQHLCLEPAAGDGAIVRELVEWCGAAVDCYEIREECHLPLRAIPDFGLGRVNLVSIRDFLGVQPDSRLADYDVVMTNPPYNRALEFVQHSLDFIHVDGIVVMLLRLAFLEGQERTKWMRRHMPDVFVLPRRPCFDPDPPPVCEPSQTGKHVFPKKKVEGTDRIRCDFCGCVKPGTDASAYAWMVWRKYQRTDGVVRLLEASL